MRTTLTLDDDLAARLADLANLERKAFKVVVNETIRRGLLETRPVAAKPFKVRPFATKLKPGIDPRGFNKLYDDLETDDYLRKLSPKR